MQEDKGGRCLPDCFMSASRPSSSRSQSIAGELEKNVGRARIFWVLLFEDGVVLLLYQTQGLVERLLLFEDDAVVLVLRGLGGN